MRGLPRIGPCFKNVGGKPYVATPLRPRFPHLAERGARRRGACREWRTPPDPVRGKPRTYDVPTGCHSPLESRGRADRRGVVEKAGTGPKVCFTNIGVKPPQAIQLHLRSPHLGKRTPVDAGLAPHWALCQERWWEVYVATPLRPRFPHLAEYGPVDAEPAANGAPRRIRCGASPHLQRSHRSRSPLESRGRADRRGVVGKAGVGPDVCVADIGVTPPRRCYCALMAIACRPLPLSLALASASSLALP